MKKWFLAKRQWLMATASVASIAVGALSLQSCAGGGGPIGGNGGGDNSVLQAFLALLPAEQSDASYVGADSCKTCHDGGKSREASDEIWSDWHDTKHASVNVSCEQCHGPGSKHAAAPATTNILTYPKIHSSVVCAQCHGPTYDQWKHSGHANLVTSAAGNTSKSSRCMACHSNLARTEILEKGVDFASVANADLSQMADDTLNVVPHTATCSTCHNPHKKTENLTADGLEKQIRQPVSNLDTTPIAPDTAASSFTTFAHICAECHNGRGTSPDDSKLTSGTSRPSMHDSNQYNMLMGTGGVVGGGPVVQNTAHAQAPGQCVKCHMPDSKHTFTVQYDSSCSPCHSTSDAAARATSTKGEVLSKLYALLTRMQNWADDTFGDSELWNYTSLIPSGHTAPNQALIPIEVKRARHNYFFVVRDASLGVHNAPYALHLIQIANDNLDNLGVAPVMPAFERSTPASAKMKAIMQTLKQAKQADMEAGH